MAYKNHTTDLTALLLKCVVQPDPMLSMLEWLCSQFMKAEAAQQLGAEKSQCTDGRSGYRSGYGRIVSMAVLLVCGVDENGRRDMIAVEPMAEESEESDKTLFENLKERGMTTPKLVISDAHAGLTAAIRKSLPGASWQRCKVHFSGISWPTFPRGARRQLLQS